MPLPAVLRKPPVIVLTVTLAAILFGTLLGTLALPAVIGGAGDAGPVAAAPPEPAAPPEHSDIKVAPIDVITNIAGQFGRRYLKVNVVLEVKDKGVKADAEKRADDLKDLLMCILSDKTLEELEGKDKKDALRGEIRRVVNDRLGSPDAVLHVYFDQFIIQ